MVCGVCIYVVWVCGVVYGVYVTQYVYDVGVFSFVREVQYICDMSVWYVYNRYTEYIWFICCTRCVVRV